ncbi:hypothetical protein EV424DRAFT_1541317 [Suillus variegatus]|nr:hypothetical protein EV424DRAFT_1541317 [Suillus variegatus]
MPRDPIHSHKLGIALLDGKRFEYDKTKEWESSNLLCVGGRGIPVKYWGEFYKRGKGVKNTAWDALRVEWGNWKFIAEERQHYPDTASFWRAFTATQDANDARTFFDGNLDHPLAQGAFRYTKGGKSYVSSKDDAVAKKWRELLATRLDISSRVLAAQSSSQ